MKRVFALFALFAGTAGAVETVPVHGSIAILHAVPPVATSTVSGVDAQKYTVLSNTIDRAFVDDDDDTCSPLVGGLSLPAGEYLFELLQPPPFDTNLNCSASTVFKPSSNSPTSGYASDGCSVARVLFNTKNTDGTAVRRQRLVNGAAIFSFDERNADCSYNQTFGVRFHIQGGWMSASRPSSSYTATLKITKLREPVAEETPEETTEETED